MENGILVNQALDSNAETIYVLLEENRQWLHGLGINQWILPFTKDWVEQSIARGEFFVAKRSQEVVGVFRLIHCDPVIWDEIIAEDGIYIHTLAIRRKDEGQGIGRSLLAWAEKYTKDQGRQYLRLDCMADNPRLCEYYRCAGFVSRGVKEIQFPNFLWKAELFEKEV